MPAHVIRIHRIRYAVGVSHALSELFLIEQHQNTRESGTERQQKRGFPRIGYSPYIAHRSDGDSVQNF
jgi:hypothetical protein